MPSDHPPSEAPPLEGRWPIAGLHVVRDTLLAAWTAPERGYHDARHLGEVLDRLDELASGGVDFPSLPVALAAWFHDGVYDALPGAEERSAAWAERALSDSLDQELVAEVARLVRLTEHHRPAVGDESGAALSDADLAILAADEERYAAYVAGVRREYAHVPDAAFTAGRTAVLRDLLAAPTLFHTAYARERWEARARANVERELLGGAG